MLKNFKIRTRFFSSCTVRILFHSKISNFGVTFAQGALAMDEKRRLDARIAALESELEEEQTQSEMLMERARKSQISIEQLTTELASERGNAQKMENSKMMLKDQIHGHRQKERIHKEQTS